MISLSVSQIRECRDTLLLLLLSGARGPHDAEQEVLRRDRTRSVRQEQENPGRARAATLHPNHEPEREAQERGERVKCFASCRISAVLTCKYEILKNSDKTEQSSGQFI